MNVIAFDVNETLFGFDRLGPAFTDAGLDPNLVPVWFARLLRDGFALAALGGYRPFADVAAETLRGLHTTITDDAFFIMKAASSAEPCLTERVSALPACETSPPKPPRMTEMNERFIPLHMM